MPSGKRIKVRAKDVLLQFAQPIAGPDAGRGAGARRRRSISTSCGKWRGRRSSALPISAPNTSAMRPQRTRRPACLLRLHAAPIYFYKKGKGRYKAAPEAALKAALAGIEKKKQQALVQAEYVRRAEGRRAAGARCSRWRANCCSSRTRTASSTRRWKPPATNCRPRRSALMLATGGIASAQGAAFLALPVRVFPARDWSSRRCRCRPRQRCRWPTSQAFSIDDVTTTEIDDAFSVERQADGKLRIGIHIAAPGWASGATMRSTPSRASACRPCTCRATRSPCCRTRWSTPTPWPPARPARRCRCMRWSIRPTGRCWPPRPKPRRCRSPATCATTISTRW